MNDRTGQVWWARKNRINDSFEPCLIIGMMENTGPDGPWWVMHTLEKLGNAAEAHGQFERDFLHVEGGGDHAWLKSRID